MAASIVRWKGGGNFSNLVTSLWRNRLFVLCQQELHTSQSFQIDRRKDKEISQYLRYRNHEKTVQHRHHPIHELPDYSYSDGRPTEVAICQKSRQDRNYQLAKQIVQLVGEMKFAQEQLLSQAADKSRNEQARLDSRLKEKGTPM
ncbi:unnamed protein product [Candidula unifasciata]|uniref:Large ribosomal subunit protein mL52 n=1 Tax=Candidula unifasciata TaxID=100452 RepID=A0A8S3ZEY8_9EUPU|nr:unnamed protein product [Candidula unifasciata]